MASQFLTAQEAAKLVKSGSTLASDGFVGSCFAEEIASALEQRFLETGEPRDLTLVFTAGQGDSKDRGMNHFGHEGMVKRAVGGHWNLVPKLQKLAFENKMEAYNLPQGVLAHLMRDVAAGRPGLITHVGLKTFIDPRERGGKLNDVTKEDIVELITVGGKEYLFYKAFPITVAMLRGTYADTRGNTTMQREIMRASALATAQACRNSGGLILVQVEDIVKEETLDPRLVVIPGICTDVIVKTSDVYAYHQQSYGERYRPGMSGEAVVSLDSIPAMEMSERKVICRRAAMELKRGDVVNLGIGMPEGVAAVANEQGRTGDFTLTIESGLIGGVSQGGLSFGGAYNPQAMIDQGSQFDFYDGGGIDRAFLGLAQMDGAGNVNVSQFGPRIAGVGGFVDIAQNTKSVVFCGTFTADGLEIATQGGLVKIIKEGKTKKFVRGVNQITFSGEYAQMVGQNVLYVTERAVFRLTPDGVELIEVAPGIDVQRDILPYMEFKPTITDVKPMPAELFIP